MTSIYDQDLPRNEANFAPISPLSFIERTAEVYPDRLAVVHGALRQTWASTRERCYRLASALVRMGVQPGDTVFCSSLTFVGSCNPILYCGARPVFIDSERQTWNMSAPALERAIGCGHRIAGLYRLVETQCRWHIAWPPDLPHHACQHNRQQPSTGQRPL